MFFTHPNHITKWKDGQDLLAIPTIDSDTVTIRNIRDFRYAKWGTPTSLAYLDRTYDVSVLESCLIYSIPFGKGDLFSHLILGFRFEDGTQIALSVEARRRPNEDYSVLKGFLPYYGLIYIWGTVDDLVWLRKDARGDTVYEYPLSLNRDTAKKLFLDCIARTDKLPKKPETYGSFSNNCTTNVIEHIVRVQNQKYPTWDYRVVLSGKIEGYLREVGWIS